MMIFAGCCYSLAPRSLQVAAPPAPSAAASRPASRVATVVWRLSWRQAAVSPPADQLPLPP
eukprot:10322411-Heterocapsa_arctica.AAC.1